MARTPYRTCVAAVGLALLVALAGCPGPLDPGGGSGPATETAETDGTAPEESESERTTDGANGTDAAASGQLLFAVDGRDTHLDDSATGGGGDGAAWLNESDRHTWHVPNDSTTLAAALDALGVDATADALTYAGETYRESASGTSNRSTNATSIEYRVDGETVADPSTYRLEDGDEVLVTVYVSNVTTPGREYSSSHPHPHGTLSATVDGQETNFSRERFVMNDPYFHFHGDENASRWHAHSLNLTAGYALSTFPGFDVTNGTVTHNGTTYDPSDPGTSVNVTVNGESVDPDRYVLKDGDDLRLVVNESG